MPFRTIRLAPGVNIEQTPTYNQTNLADSNLVRFYQGMVQKLGGWSHMNTTPLIGTCRGMAAWADQNQNIYTACGTEQRLQVLEAGAILDITPVVQTDNITPTVGTTAGSPTVTISDGDYSPSVNDWINFTTQVSVGGLILYGYYQVTGFTGGTEYTITSASNATSTAAVGAVPVFTTTVGGDVVKVTLANHGLVTGNSITFALSTTVGGVTIDGVYPVTVLDANDFTISVASTATSSASASMNGGDMQILYLLPTGLAVNTPLTGWGVGNWGEGNWGVGDGEQITGYMRQWSMANWGLSLIASYTQGGIYYWTPPVVSPAQPLATVLSPPPEPVLTYTAGGTLAAQSYYVKTTYVQSNGGETLPSTESSITVPANNVLNVASPPASGSASGWNVYVGNSSGAETEQNTGSMAIGANYVEPITGLVAGGNSVPTVNTTSGSPLYNNSIFIIPQAQIIVALGAEAGGTQNNLLVRWCDAGDFTDWVATATNQAGSFLFSSGTKIIGGTPVGLGALIWTDVDVWYMQYIGYPLVFSFTQLAGSCGIMSMRSGADTAGFVIWLSTRGFFTYQAGGGVDAMESPVWDWVFENIDLSQTDACHLAVNSLYNEMGWHFPVSPTSPIYSPETPYAYVKYNFVENAWDKGISSQYQRTAWIEKNPQSYPAGTDLNGIIQQHEVSNDADGAPMAWSFQTGYFSLMEGEEFIFVDLIVPDFAVNWTGTTPPVINVSLLCTDYPVGLAVGEPLQDGPYPINFGTPANLMVPVRMRARQIALLFQGNDLGSFFRIGAVRVRFAADGRN